MRYEEALAEEKRVGASRCGNEALMAGLCETVIPLVIGAVGPRLVYEGAQKAGLNARKLMALVHDEPAKVEELQWL